MLQYASTYTVHLFVGYMQANNSEAYLVTVSKKKLGTACSIRSHVEKADGFYPIPDHVASKNRVHAIVFISWEWIKTRQPPKKTADYIDTEDGWLDSIAY